jgi:hypothetical protein
VSIQIIRDSVWKQVIKDIRSGVRDRELLEKYELSPRRTRVLSAVRSILKGELVRDIRSGMSDPDLSRKYGISSAALRTVFIRLVDAGALSREDVDARCAALSRDVSYRRTARSPRNYVPYPVTVQVVGESKASGLLLDITETGVSVAGIDARIDEIKTFRVIANGIGRTRPFVFEARCRWTGEDVDGERIAGYSIERISGHDSWRLRDFMETLSPVWREAESAD